MSTPSVAELEAATAATETAIQSGDLADIYLAAEREEALYTEIFTGPCDTPALEADEPEAEASI